MAARLRPITVAGRRFRWRFNGRLVVIPEGRSGPQLVIDWGWRDWLEPEGSSSDPQIITPQFVEKATRFALSHGWEPDVNGPPTQLTFWAGGFAVTCRHAEQS